MQRMLRSDLPNEPTGIAPAPPRPAHLTRLAWLPIPAYILAMIVVYAHNLQTTYESPVLLATLNTLFCTAVSLLIVYLAARSFLETGSRGVLCLGAGALAYGTVTILAGLLLHETNAVLTVYNTGCGVAGACFLCSAVLTLRTTVPAAQHPPTVRQLALVYLGVLLVLGLLVLGAIAGAFPPFYREGMTPLRQSVLGVTVTLFLLASLGYGLLYRRMRIIFLHWCCIGLALIGLGLLTVLLIKSIASPLNWLGRGGQYLGGLYLLFAILSVVKGAWLLPLERALRESEDRFRLALQHAPITVATFDRDLRYTWIYNTPHGFQPQQVLGKRPDELIPPHDAAEFMALLRQTLESEVVIRGEVSGHTHGERWVYDITAECLRDADGRVIGVNMAIIDITERVQAEEALRESETRYHALFNSMTEGFALHEIVLTADGTPCDYRFLDINPAFERLTGLRREDIVGRLKNDVLPDDDPFWMQIYGEVALTGDPSHFEHYSPALDRHYRVFAYCPAPRQFAVLFMDITALKEADHAKDEFLAVLSHELQTPLTAILGWSAEALRQDNPDFINHAMAVVHRNAVRQARLVNEILDMSRLIHRKITLEPVPTDLWMQANLAVENVRHLAAERTLSLTLAPTDEPLPITADPERLQQCIANLLHNSVKFTPTDGSITVRCCRVGSEALLSVCDTGRGIPPEELPTVFAVFRQVNRDEKAGGLGLGLAVTRGIVELHGGRIWADSAGVGQGSTFTIALPSDAARNETERSSPHGNTHPAG